MGWTVIIVSYGGGTNSVAILLLLKDLGISPDHIHFADTRGERPYTYEHIDIMRGWCADNDFPDIVTLTNGGAGESLEDNCIRRKALPSIAYGFKTCSQRWKVQPSDKYYNNLPDCKAVWKSGEPITKIIGFDADEPQRAKESPDTKYRNWYPLIENDMGREECIALIDKHGIPQPRKSSCFYCPSMRDSEIRELQANYPDLAKRALDMEANADLDTVAGLGRSFRWADVLATDDMFPQSLEIDCGCYDG